MSMRLAMYVSMYTYTYEKVSLYEQVNIRSLSVRLAMHLSMCIYTYEKVSLYWTSEHKIYV